MDDRITPVDLEKITSLCKRRGFVFQNSEIYGGLASTWDYGPLGVELKRNIKDAWWRSFVWNREDVIGLDSAIMMHPDAWEASGHLENFSDPLVDCKNCRQRFRLDELDELKCISCGGNLTEPRMFNLMFKTFMGPLEDVASTVYLRPETAQGIFVNFNNVLNASRKKLPFGIAQIGKAFRNEITTRNFIFRTREFEIMEIEYFVHPNDAQNCYQKWIDNSMRWYLDLGINKNRLRPRAHSAEEMAHYANATTDIEYEFPWGWGEIQGIANRGDYDLNAHSKKSNETMDYFDAETGERIVPYVIEPSSGADRVLMAFLVDAYTEEEAPTASGGTERRVLLKLHSKLSPIKVAILPLSRNEKLKPLALDVHKIVQSSNSITGEVQYDDAQSIGRRYRRQDEIGTPFCVTVDFDSLDDKAVTIRDRDTMVQDRIPIADLSQELSKRLDA